MNEKTSRHVCQHCNQEGGKKLGIDNDGNEVCNLCGEYDNKHFEYVHFATWQWSNFTANNRTLNKSNPKASNEK